MNKKILLVGIGAVIILGAIIFAGIAGKDDADENLNYDNDVEYEENYEINEEENFESNNSTKKVSLLLGYESSETINIEFDTERFAVEEYAFSEPQDTIYFTDKTNGNSYTVSTFDMSGSSVQDYYNKLVNTAKKNAKAEDFKATEMVDVKYGGINFKKFSVSWSKPYEYTSKETGELVSGVSNNEETAIFAEIKPGIFLRYEGPADEEILEKLFIKIEK